MSAHLSPCGHRGMKEEEEEEEGCYWGDTCFFSQPSRVSGLTAETVLIPGAPSLSSSSSASSTWFVSQLKLFSLEERRRKKKRATLEPPSSKCTPRSIEGPITLRDYFVLIRVCHAMFRLLFPSLDRRNQRVTKHTAGRKTGNDVRITQIQ